MGDSPAYRIVGPPEGNQRTANKRTTGNDILKAAAFKALYSKSLIW